eukprot:580291-Rhodomonas_salina.1
MTQESCALSKELTLAWFRAQTMGSEKRENRGDVLDVLFDCGRVDQDVIHEGDGEAVAGTKDVCDHV